MSVHRVLVERDQQVDPVAHIGYLARTGANCQEGMAAANDGLIGVVRVQMQPAAAENLRKNIAGRGHTLTGGASDTHSEGLPHTHLPKPAHRVSEPDCQRTIEQSDSTARQKCRQVPG